MKDLIDTDASGRRPANEDTASVALQKMVDALASLPALEHFVPSALRIIAGAFETNDCAYYEHRRGDQIRLRYWFFEGQVFGPEDIQAFGSEHPYADVKVLESGFLMPDSYLGVPFRNRTRAQVVDHRGDRPGDTWYELRRHHQWYVSLNVPLVIDGEADGALVVNRGFDFTFSASEVALAERLGQQLALAMEIDRLAIKARQAASAEARELATQMQIEEMTKIDHTLQQMTDTLAAMPDLADFVPAALMIIATSFNLKDCAYYEHRQGDPIRLRYWFIEDRVLSPEDISALDGDNSSMRRLAVEGFLVSDEYIGVPFRKRVRATVIDHSKGSPPSVFGVECTRRGWDLELNVPLVVAGEADGALLIYRGAMAPFSDREIRLAERLAQQLALAIEASRLAEESKQAALARQRERAAVERAVESARANEVLRSTLDQLSREHDLGSFPRTILRETMHYTGAQDGIILRYDEYTDALVPSDWLSVDGEPAPPDLARPYSAGATSTWNTLVRTRAPMVFDIAEHAWAMSNELSAWHRRRGNCSVVAVAVFVGPDPYGYFGITLRERAQDVSAEQIGVVHSLAQQATLAIQLTRLAEVSQQAAITVERERVVAQERGNMAREIHDRLAQGYAAILVQQHTIRRMLIRGDAKTFDTSPLLEQLGIIEHLSRENLAEARRAMDELRTDPFELVDLSASLRHCVQKLSTDQSFEISLLLQEELPRLRRYVETELGRIVLEAVTNARKHARTSGVQVSASKRGDTLRITVEDQGLGFDPDRIDPSFGLSSMQERAARAGARVEVKSQLGSGTQVLISLTL